MTDVFLLPPWETGKWHSGEAPAWILIPVSGCPGGSAGPHQVDQIGNSPDLAGRGQKTTYRQSPDNHSGDEPVWTLAADPGRLPSPPRVEGRAKSTQLGTNASLQAAAKGRVFPKSLGTRDRYSLARAIPKSLTEP